MEGVIELVIREKIFVDKEFWKIYEDGDESKGIRFFLLFGSKDNFVSEVIFFWFLIYEKGEIDKGLE